MLASLTTLKLWLSITDTKDDALLTSLLEAASMRFERACNRKFGYQAGYTELLDGDVFTLSLERFPILSIASIKESIDHDWTNTTALVENTDYTVNYKAGIVCREYGRWLRGRQCIQIVYAGGYILPGDEAVTGVEDLPADIQNAVLEQCRFLWIHKPDIGLKNVGMGGGSWSISDGEDWITSVKGVINSYKRYV